MRVLWAVGVMACCVTAASGAATETSFRLPLDPQRIPMTLSGSVTDTGGTPIRGVSVWIFTAGAPTARTQTDSTGGYSVDFTLAPDRDATVMAWWVSPRPDRVSDLAIIRESAADRASGRWGPCIRRIGMERRKSCAVKLMDPISFQRALAATGCGS